MVTPGTTAMATILNVWSHRAMIHKNREMISCSLGLIRYCGCAFQATFSIMQCQGAQDGDWKWRRSCWSFRYSDKSERRGDQEGGEERDWVRRRGRGWRRRGGEECLQIWVVTLGSVSQTCTRRNCLGQSKELLERTGSKYSYNSHRLTSVYWPTGYSRKYNTKLALF